MGTPASCTASAPTSSLAPLHTLLAAVVLPVSEARPGPDRSLGSQTCRFALSPAPFPSRVTLLFSEATSTSWASLLLYLSQVTAYNRCLIQEDALSLVLKPGSGYYLPGTSPSSLWQGSPMLLLSPLVLYNGTGQFRNSGVLLRRTAR